MNYGSRNLDYALRVGLVDAVENDDYAEAKQPQYARKRSAKALRKRSGQRSSSTPGCGISARCNRRYEF
ncbi:hypothetical protein N9N28_12305 [Rubripirellula amarantea]|nr:hypothetical protein [Rubripirellula amarantea]